MNQLLSHYFSAVAASLKLLCSHVHEHMIAAPLLGALVCVYMQAAQRCQATRRDWTVAIIYFRSHRSLGEPPRLFRRLVQLSTGTDLIDLSSVVGLLVLDRWHVADRAKEAVVVELPDPFQRREFDILMAVPRAAAPDHFRLE